MNLQFGLKEGDLEMILQVLAKYPQIEKAIIYGSRANNTFKPGSDVDIAIIGDVRYITWEVSSELNDETLLPYHFDITDYNKIKEPALKEQIDKYGIEFYNSKKIGIQDIFIV
jgi:predicted nucleotidyltransferase